ncbi:MAG: hypothetical protein ABH823_05750 [bacterium]
MNARCRLFADDQKRIIEHYRKGEDPYNPDVVLKDVAKDMNDTMELIAKAAEEEGIDLSNLPEEDCERLDISGHSLYLRANYYMRLVHKFLEKLRRKINAVYRSEVFLLSNNKWDEQEQIDDFREIITWYHTFVPSKIYRALCSKMEATDSNEDLQQLDLDDANGSAKVAYIGLTKSLEALYGVHKWAPELQDETLTLLAEVEKLLKGINAEFPDHHNFKRPGFDYIA